MRRSWTVGVWVAIGLIGRSTVVEAGLEEPVLVALERDAEIEYFALRADRPATEGSAPEEPTSIGGLVLKWSHDDESRASQLDLELALEATRVLQVEESTPEGRTCVWRELRAGSGRTIAFDVQPDGTEAIEWSPAGTKRRTVWPAERGLGLLELIELARADRAPDEARWIDPLACELLTVGIAVERRGPVRTVDVRAASGDRVAYLSFEGQQLTRLAWQAGGLMAERITADAYDRLIADRRRFAARYARTE